MRALTRVSGFSRATWCPASTSGEPSRHAFCWCGVCVCVCVCVRACRRYVRVSSQTHRWNLPSVVECECECETDTCRLGIHACTAVNRRGNTPSEIQLRHRRRAQTPHRCVCLCACATCESRRGAVRRRHAAGRLGLQVSSASSLSFSSSRGFPSRPPRLPSTDTYDKILRVEYGNFKASASSLTSFLWRREIDDQQGFRIYTAAPPRPAGTACK